MFDKKKTLWLIEKCWMSDWTFVRKCPIRYFLYDLGDTHISYKHVEQYLQNKSSLCFFWLSRNSGLPNCHKSYSKSHLEISSKFLPVRGCSQKQQKRISLYIFKGQISTKIKKNPYNNLFPLQNFEYLSWMYMRFTFTPKEG